LDPEEPLFYDNRGLAKSEIEDYNGAIEDYTVSIELFPNDPEPYYYRGMAKINLGNNYDGCLDLNRASQLGSSNAGKAIKEYCK
jgi:tetratricopeptide (TPR) repeat protein